MGNGQLLVKVELSRAFYFPWPINNVKILRLTVSREKNVAARGNLQNRGGQIRVFKMVWFVSAPAEL